MTQQDADGVWQFDPSNPNVRWLIKPSDLWKAKTTDITASYKPNKTVAKADGTDTITIQINLLDPITGHQYAYNASLIFQVLDSQSGISTVTIGFINGVGSLNLISQISGLHTLQPQRTQISYLYQGASYPKGISGSLTVSFQ